MKVSGAKDERKDYRMVAIRLVGLFFCVALFFIQVYPDALPKWMRMSIHLCFLVTMLCYIVLLCIRKRLRG